MKPLITLSLCMALTAWADTIATVPNTADGKMVLTDIKCTDKPGWVVYSSSPKATTQFGCWFSDDSMVHITWSDGDFRSYPLNRWEINFDVLQRLRNKLGKSL